ncbi:hypothetical protein ACFFWD_24915 [Bradyrhizobium erythrophlei]|uniref:hypothetical protein n=1 Tax=Bradyrhizobium erythrophlei TaxID=1437360 RepID=UPI0035E562B2
MKLDFYRGTNDDTLRMAVEAGRGLPGHVDPKDWKPMTADDGELAAFEEDIVSDIEARGFCFYKILPPRVESTP